MDVGGKIFRVRNLIGNVNATLPAFGQIVFEATRLYVEQGQIVTLDFTGIHQLTESFIRSSIGKLITADPDQKQLVKVMGLQNKEWEDEIRNVIKSELNPYEIEFTQKKLNDIFI